MNSTHPRSFNTNEPAVNLHLKYDHAFNVAEFLTSFVQSNLCLDTDDKLFTTTPSYTTGRAR